MIIDFKGEICVEGDTKSLDMEKLKEYLEQTILFDIDTEEHGVFSDDIEVTGAKLDWESLEVSPDKM